MSLENLTVITHTENLQEQNLTRFLNALPEWMPLIIVDSSKDHLPFFISEYRPKNTKVLLHPGSKAEGLQTAALTSQTRWILFADLNSSFSRDYFKHIRQYGTNRRYSGYDFIYDVIYGTRLSRFDFKHYYQFLSYLQFLFHQINISGISGTNILVNRHTFFAVGGFDRSLKHHHEMELVWRIKRYGYHVHYDPEFIVYAESHDDIAKNPIGSIAKNIFQIISIYLDLMPKNLFEGDWEYWLTEQQFENNLIP